MIISVDPGESGGIAACWGNATEVHNMPATRGDAIELCRYFVDACRSGTRFNPPTVYVEKISGFVDCAGAGQQFAFGVNVERIGCIFQTLGAKIVEVPPKKWQAALGLGSPGPRVKAERNADEAARKNASSANGRRKRDWKNKLKAEAQRRFPGLKVTLGNADALLILAYAQLNELVKVAEATDWP